jgi:Peptidase C13 family
MAIILTHVARGSVVTRLAAELRIAFRRAFKLLLLKKISTGARGVSSSLLIFLFAACLLSIAGFDAVKAGEKLGFNEYGVVSTVAMCAIFAAALSALSISQRPSPVRRILSDTLTLCIIGFALSAFVGVVLRSAGLSIGWSESPPTAILIMLPNIVSIWLILAMWRLGHSTSQKLARFSGAKLVLAFALGAFLIPYQPIVYGSSTSWETYDVWRWSRYAFASLAPPAVADAEQETAESKLNVESTYHQQASIIKSTLGNLLPSPPNRSQLYFVGMAPSAQQSVFATEVAGAQAVFDKMQGTEGRSMVLINNVGTADKVPLANNSNLAEVLEGVGRVMDRDKDVLVLFITSHGSQNIVSVDFPYFDFNQMTPGTLSQALSNSGIKNRIIIISACHSGSFIPALQNPNTIIMTAAHADKVSFGCSNEREWTYFGDALINHALRSTRSFTQAFEQAKELIKEWETKQQLTPSEPQVSIGTEIVKLLDDSRRGTLEEVLPVEAQMQ